MRLHIEATPVQAYTYDMAARLKQGKKTMRNSRQADAIGAARDWGIDVTMLIDNMQRSYSERILRHQIALQTVEKLRKAKHL